MIARWRVFSGFVAGLLFIYFAHVRSWAQYAIGILLALAGLALRGWAAGYLEKGKRLAQDGPYAWVRHPLYTGSFLMALGFTVAGTAAYYPYHRWLLWMLFLVLFVGIYPARIKEEEATLESRFGDAWRVFTAKNRRFLPRLAPNRRPDADHFSWERYKKNKEYQAAWGWLAGAVLLAAKGLLRW